MMISIGGLSHYSHCLCNALEEAGVKTVLITDDAFEFAELERKYELQQCLGKTREFNKWMKAVLAAIKMYLPDILHVQFYRKYLTVDIMLVQMIKQAFSIPMVYTVHDLQTFRLTKMSGLTTMHHYMLLRHVFFPMFDLFIAHSPDMKTAFSRLYGIDREVVSVIPHGIMDIYDFKRHTPASARRKLGFVEDDYVLLNFGIMSRRKGLESLLRAFETLKGANGQLKLVLAGEGRKYYGRQLAGLTDNRGLTLYNDLRRVPVDEIELLFKACDAVVLPYVESTTSGNARIAMAFDKPIIATEVGEFSDLSKEYDKFVLVQKNNPKQLCAAIDTLFRNRDAEVPGRADQNARWKNIGRETGGVYLKARKAFAGRDGK